MCIAYALSFRVAVDAQMLAISIQVLSKSQFSTLEPELFKTMSTKHAKALHSTHAIMIHSLRFEQAGNVEAALIIGLD